MRTRRWVRSLVVAFATLALVGFHPGDDHASRTYEAPFAVGPSGGDQWNHTSATPDGRVTVARVYPIPGSGVNCGIGAGYAKLQIVHEVHAPVREIRIAYADAALDPYTFIVGAVRTGNYTWLGHATTQGPLAGSGELVVPVRWPERWPGAVVIEFGLELSSACPSIDAGTLRFTTVTTNEHPSTEPRGDR